MRANTVERRTELLKMEGLGFSESEIVTELSQKFNKDPRTIYRDFESRNKWQLTGDAYKHYLKAYNRLDQAFKRAGAIYLMNSSNANAQLGAIRIMTDIAIKQIELTGYKPPEAPPGLTVISWKPLDDKEHLLLKEYEHALGEAVAKDIQARVATLLSGETPKDSPYFKANYSEDEMKVFDAASEIIKKHSFDKRESIH